MLCDGNTSFVTVSLASVPCYMSYIRLDRTDGDPELDDAPLHRGYFSICSISSTNSKIRKQHDRKQIPHRCLTTSQCQSQGHEQRKGSRVINNAPASVYKQVRSFVTSYSSQELRQHTRNLNQLLNTMTTTMRGRM